MAENSKAGGGIAAAFFGVLTAILALDFWAGLFSGIVNGDPLLFITIGVVVLVVVGIALWVRYDDEGELVFRAELVDETIPPPHTPSVPPVVSLFARGFVISDDGHLQQESSPSTPVMLRRRRLNRLGLSRRLVSIGVGALPTKALPPSTVVEDGRRYTHSFVAGINVAALADMLRDPAKLAEIGVRRDRPFNAERYVVRLTPVADDGSPVLKWQGGVQPSGFGHALDEVAPGTRCGRAVTLAGDGWLTWPLNTPRGRFRDENGTVYVATGRAVLLGEHECFDMRIDGEL